MKSDTIEQVSVDKLIPYARNSRTHSDAQVAQIAASIKEFGFVNPVLIDESDGLIAGHGRVMAARKLGINEVPCIRLSHLDENQKRAYIIADNKLALNAGWDDEMLALEISDLQDAGFDLKFTGFNNKELQNFLDKATAEDIYSNKIAVPTYEPRNQKPSIKDLYSDEKAIDLIANIKESKLSQAEKEFLMVSASRHIVFNYSKIADFYAHSSKECQELMEKNALVIIDYKQAIENGFVHLTEQINDLNDEE